MIDQTNCCSVFQVQASVLGRWHLDLFVRSLVAEVLSRMDLQRSSIKNDELLGGGYNG